MSAHRQAPLWGALFDTDHARDKTGWSHQLRSWWTAHQAARQEAHLTSLRTRWDASREAVTPCRADAAPEMAAAHGARSAAMLVYSLAV